MGTALAFTALAAVSVGALSIGALSVGALTMGKGRIKKLRIEGHTDSDGNDAPDEGPTQTGEKPNDKDLSREAILPGYNHLDVATAAWRQNDGRREGSSLELARFMLKVIRPKGSDP